MPTPPSKQLDQFVVRLPNGMRDRIKAAAETNNRSMNAEIVATLEEKYPAPTPSNPSAYIMEYINFIEGLNEIEAKKEAAADLNQYIASTFHLPFCVCVHEDGEYAGMTYITALDRPKFAEAQSRPPYTRPDQPTAQPNPAPGRPNPPRRLPPR